MALPDAMELAVEVPAFRQQPEIGPASFRRVPDALSADERA
jgi:hypothetical protein